MNRYHEPVIPAGGRRCIVEIGADPSSLASPAYDGPVLCGLLPEEHELPAIWRASFDSRHFAFEAYGTTEEDAREAMLAALVAHAVEYDTAPDWYVEYLDDIQLHEYRMGVGYRDRSTIKA